MTSVALVVEGIVDRAIALRVVAVSGLVVGPVYVKNGKSQLDAGLAGYNKAASFSRWFVLRDLDEDAPCAPDLVRRLLSKRASGMCFRLAVRQVESWLLADREAFEHYFGVSARHLPASPDRLADAKRTLLGLVARHAAKDLRQGMLPRRGTTARVGPEYSGHLIRFGQTWSPRRARRVSDSLDRCLVALRTLKELRFPSGRSRS